MTAPRGAEDSAVRVDHHRAENRTWWVGGRTAWTGTGIACSSPSAQDVHFFRQRHGNDRGAIQASPLLGLVGATAVYEEPREDCHEGKQKRDDEDKCSYEQHV
jgi:hypothetical protein